MCLCSSVVLADVWNTTVTQQVKTNYVLWSVLPLVFFFYLHDSTFQRASAWATSWEKCGCWFLGRNVEAAAAKRRNFRLLLKNKQFFKSSDKTSSRLARQEVQPPCFLLTWYVPRPRPTGIRTNDTVQSIFVSLVEKSTVPFVHTEKATENSIQMVNAPEKPCRESIKYNKTGKSGTHTLLYFHDV